MGDNLNMNKDNQKSVLFWVINCKCILFFMSPKSCFFVYCVLLIDKPIDNSAAEVASEKGTVNVTTHENSNSSKWSNQLITCDKNRDGEVFLHKSIEKNTVIPVSDTSTAHD